MRTDSRIFAFKFVFGEIFNQNMDGEEQINILQEEQALNDKDLSFSHEIINAYNQNKDTIKADVENALEGYQLDRVFTSSQRESFPSENAPAPENPVVILQGLHPMHFPS